jgi:hypothetical protein
MKLTSSKKIDDIDYHTVSLEETEPVEDAGLHVALFVYWLIKKGYFDLPDTQDAITKLVSGEMSANEFLEQQCDGQLFTDMVREDLRPFVVAYYDTKALKGWATYFEDYDKVILGGKDTYKVKESEIDKRQIVAMLDKRYNEWLSTYSTVQSKKSLLGRLFEALGSKIEPK